MPVIVANDPPLVPATSDPSSHPSPGDWRVAMKQAVREPAELCRLLDLPLAWGERAVQASRHFPLFAPRGYIARMRPGDPADPLLRQVLPVVEEGRLAPGDRTDPVDDQSASLRPGLLQKYHGRALLVTTGACAVHCRYCFRRHFPYSESPRSPEAWQPALDLIAGDASIREVILSGGDPLTLVDEHLAELVRRIADIRHVRWLRVHTRLPVLVPERVTDRLLEWLTETRLVVRMVIHANHAAELDATVGMAIGRFVRSGIVTLNQSVLLRGVNDRADALVALCERLVDLNVTPYYLHQLDPVAGAAHFHVPIAEGRRLMADVRARLPGHAVPRYVQEIPGAASKVPLA